MKKLTYRLRDIREERFRAKYEIRGLHKLPEFEASEYHRAFFASRNCNSKKMVLKFDFRSIPSFDHFFIFLPSI